MFESIQPGLTNLGQPIVELDLVRLLSTASELGLID